MPDHFVYIAQSADGRLYVGYTTDLARRMRQHARGQGSKFLRGFGFHALCYCETHPTKSAALRREVQLKKFTRAQKQQLIAAP